MARSAKVESAAACDPAGDSLDFVPDVFRNVVVYPTQELLKPPFVLFRGGPDWPNFWMRRHERHCRFDPPIPLDLRPRRLPSDYGDYEASGIWCGPVTQHFGHAIASFGSRIAVAGQLSSMVPLVFSARPGEDPPRFFWEVLRHFGIDHPRIRIVRVATMYGCLAVTRQAETLFGKAPGTAYLSLLKQFEGSGRSDHSSKLYVSRAAMWKGKIAGEAYMERAFARLGFETFRPEDYPLEEQLTAYRNAKCLVFADGSALHALQLLGRLQADVIVIARRRRRRTAEAALTARGAKPFYVDAIKGVVHGVGRTGSSQPSAGLSLIDHAALLAQFDELGVTLRRVWDIGEFEAQEAQDLGVWIEARSLHPPHPRDGKVVARTLTSFRRR